MSMKGPNGSLVKEKVFPVLLFFNLDNDELCYILNLFHSNPGVSLPCNICKVRVSHFGSQLIATHQIPGGEMNELKQYELRDDINRPDFFTALAELKKHHDCKVMLATACKQRSVHPFSVRVSSSHSHPDAIQSILDGKRLMGWDPRYGAPPDPMHTMHGIRVHLLTFLDALLDSMPEGKTIRAEIDRLIIILSQSRNPDMKYRFHDGREH